MNWHHDKLSCHQKEEQRAWSIKSLQKRLSKKTIRIMLALGLAVFIPVYVYNIGLLKTMSFDMSEYASVTRIVLLYLIFLWGLVSAGYFTVRSIKKKRAS